MPVTFDWIKLAGDWIKLASRAALAAGRAAPFAAIVLCHATGEAAAFDYARYEAADLDAIAARPAPAGLGADVFPVRSLRFEVTLVSQAAPCATKFLKWAMLTSGISKQFVDGVPITQCIVVKSAKGKQLTMYIQDTLTGSLAQEVAPGDSLTLYAGLVYFGQEGPGILINEFSAGKAADRTDCGCGKEMHSGLDYSAAPGTPVPVMGDGVVVKVEQDEKASVDTPTAGACGRYVVVKHSYPDGRSAYSRYAQLGRLVGAGGRPVVAGQPVKKQDIIGEVGGTGRFHFEVRPIDNATMDRSPEWSQRYAADASMDWSRYQTVDPQTFDLDKPATNGAATKAK